MHFKVLLPFISQRTREIFTSALNVSIFILFLNVIIILIIILIVFFFEEKMLSTYDQSQILLIYARKTLIFDFCKFIYVKIKNMRNHFKMRFKFFLPLKCNQMSLAQNCVAL